jgi:hypothetical protein
MRSELIDAGRHKALAYKISDAVHVSGLSRSKLFLLIRDQKLQTVKIGKARLILASSLERLLEQSAD